MIDRLREWLEAEALDAAYLTNPVSVAYLTGFRTDPHERLMALAVRGASATLIVPALEAESAGEAVRGGVEVRGWRDGEDPWRLVAEALAGAGRVGVEKDHLSYAGGERLLGLDLALADAGPALRGFRARKTAAELELLGRAAAVTDEVTGAARGLLAEAGSELELARRLADLIAAAGCKPSFEGIVQFGARSAMPHLRPGDVRPVAGDLALLDFGAEWAGYKADTTRTWVLGAASERQREVHAVVLEAHDRALATVRAGITAGEVDEAARRVIRDAGYGEHFIHRVGHGLGLEAHEDPSLDPGSATALEPGMVVTIEPGVYIPGWGGVRIEDDVVVEDSGGRLLTAAPRDLFEAG